MMLKRNIMPALVLLLIISVSGFSAETKMEGRIYSAWMMNTSAGADNLNAFTMDRSYLTAKSKLSDYTSVNITVDLRLIEYESIKINDTEEVALESNYSGYTMILKSGYVAWKPKCAKDWVTVTLGLQPTKYIEAVDGSAWGRRYILSTVGDLQKYISTADLGLTLSANLGKEGAYGSAGLAILNGTKFTDVNEKNKQKDFNPYVILKPFPNNADLDQSMLAAQFYSGTQNKAISGTTISSDYKNQIISFGGKLAYKKTFDLGFDLNWNTLGQGQGKVDKKRSAFSGFGILYLAPLVSDVSMLRAMNLIGRVDIADPNTSVGKDGQTLIFAGVECAPIKGVAASLNFRSISYQETNKRTDSYIYFNSEFRF